MENYFPQIIVVLFLPVDNRSTRITRAWKYWIQVFLFSSFIYLLRYLTRLD